MESSAPECKHCWHITGTAKLTHPPLFEETCCFCGDIHFMYKEYLAKDDGKVHGPLLHTDRKL
jgi:hypothetical protein